MRAQWWHTGPVGLCLLLGLARPAAPQTVTAGLLAHDEDDAGFRYRSFKNTGGSEIYLGVPDLGVAAHRTERNITWVSGTNNVTLCFNATANKLTTGAEQGGDSGWPYPGRNHDDDLVVQYDVHLQLEYHLDQQQSFLVHQQHEYQHLDVHQHLNEQYVYHVLVHHDDVEHDLDQ